MCFLVKLITKTPHAWMSTADFESSDSEARMFSPTEGGICSIVEVSNWLTKDDPESFGLFLVFFEESDMTSDMTSD